MPQAIPDLWRSEEDAARLYQLYLCRLQVNRQHERIVSVCRRIRHYAARGLGATHGLFTFSFEIDALCDLKHFKTAWRQLRVREDIIFGERFDLAHRKWSADDAAELQFYYAPLLFFLGRYDQGCALLETSLGFWFDGRKMSSYDFRFHVYNGDKEPWHTCRVTLSHFYARLGKDLRQWQRWEAFVNGFHPRLFRLVGIRRQDLLANARHLKVFFAKLKEVRDERITSGIGGNQSDLIESAAKVRKRQKATKRELAEFNDRIKPVLESTNRKLEEFFPELKGLLK